ncbi:hypothetical protein [Antrihabitans cavernicola]|uniref:Uncharacterized protein n=1 Tax=Antrihabitans cavernicola TaxID=2495913 RepID=A0A5A7SGM4_9NOCA|nr:hypothetical protein [Spelaeibacter cavernicola]KAA0024764.1 hypothetical protein FOY51_02180 [Spelaeibacter cavernicola]
MRDLVAVLELLVAIVSIAGTITAALWLHRTGLQLKATGLATQRLGHIAEERQRRIERAREIAQAVGNTSSAVGLGTDVVQASHSAIASIPFDVLESFPATRATSRVIRGIHDETTAGVYRAINGVNKAIGDAFRAQSQRAQAQLSPEPTRSVESERVSEEPRKPHIEPAQPLAIEAAEDDPRG